MAEVIRIGGKNAYVQVFESTRGLKTGTTVEFTGHMLEATLGPGILSKNFDGLQHDLDKMDRCFSEKRRLYTSHWKTKNYGNLNRLPNQATK